MSKYPKDANGHFDKITGKITWAHPPRLNEMNPDFEIKLTEVEAIVLRKTYENQLKFKPTLKGRK